MCVEKATERARVQRAAPDFGHQEGFGEIGVGERSGASRPGLLHRSGLIEAEGGERIGYAGKYGVVEMSRGGEEVEKC